MVLFASDFSDMYGVAFREGRPQRRLSSDLCVYISRLSRYLLASQLFSPRRDCSVAESLQQSDDGLSP